MMRPRKTLEGLTPYPVSKKPRSGYICLDMNENPRGPSPRVMQALQGLKKEHLYSYPDYQELYSALAYYTGIEAKNLILACGGDEAIRIVLDAFVEEGEKVLLTTPTYSMYNLLLKLRGVDLIEIPYGKDLVFPREKLFELVKIKPGAVILVNPASPTGEKIPQNTIEKTLKLFKDVPVLLDETYHHYSGNSSVRLVQKYPNLFILRTFSKAFSLAGLRLGYVISREENITKLSLVNPPYPVSSPAVIAAISALKDQKFLAAEVKKVKEEKKFLLKELASLELEARNTSTNFMLVKFGENPLEVKKRLAERKILVRSLDNYSPLQDYLRVSLGTRDNHLAFLQALKEIIRPKIILFDLDGVLVDVNQSYLQAIRETVGFFSSKPPDLEEIQLQKRAGGFNNDWDLTCFLLEQRGLEIPRKKVIDKFQDLYLGNNFDGFIEKEKPLIKKDFLERLSASYQLGIVTGRPKSEAIYALEKMEVLHFFPSLITMDDVHSKRGKPDPLVLKLAIKELGSKRGVYIGDNPDDMRAARAAGLVPLGCLPPDFTDEDRETLLRAGAKKILEKIDDLEEVLKCAVEV